MAFHSDMDRVDSRDKVMGKTAFAYDLKTDDMLFAYVFRSPRPHAWIRHIDLRGVLSSEGVVRVLSHRDIPGEPLFGAIKKDQPLLAKDRVRYQGEPILIIVARDEAAARRAGQAVRIEFEDIEAILDPFASRDSQTCIHDTGNLLSHRKLKKGDVEKGFQDSDIIIEHTYRTTWLDHAYLETEAGIGFLDDRKHLTVISSTQNVHYKRKEISRILAMPEENIRVIQAPTGGGFGGKLDVTVEGFLALAVYHTGKPVAMRYTREESFLAQTKRHPLHIEYKSGAKKDGTLTTVQVHIIGDTGPYISYGETVCLRVAIHATGPYEVPNVQVDSRMFYTNNPISGAMRGFGVPQLAFAHEAQMDELASALEIDPLDLRIKNGLRKGSLTATSQVLENSVGYLETLKRIEPFWRKRQKTVDNRGFGLGSMFYGIGNTGVSNPSSATLSLTDDGQVALHTGVCEIGQGSDTVLTQIACRVLELEGEKINLVRGDTDTSRDAGSSSASRQTYISGRAVFNAAKDLRVFLEAEGYYQGRRLKEIVNSMKDRRSLIFESFFDPPTTALDPRTCQGSPYATYAFAAHMTEVEVDEISGACRVAKVYAAHDVGQAINVKATQGQIYGGIAMGIGLALMEEYKPFQTESFNTYYLPTALDMPEMEVFIVEDEEPSGPFGAKGVGEPALIPQAASIINAIKDAVGVRPFELPCDMERLKGLLEKKKNRPC